MRTLPATSASGARPVVQEYASPSPRTSVTIRSVAPSRAYRTAALPAISASAASVLETQDAIERWMVPGFSALTRTPSRFSARAARYRAGPS